MSTRAARKVILLLTALALGWALPPATAPAADSVLRARLFGDLKGIDPIVTTDYMARNHGYMVYDTLFALDERMEVQPQMVERYSVSPDGLVWTFTLRPRLAFHDGQPVTAGDVVASLRRWGERDGLGQQLMARTETLMALDGRTVRLTLKARWGLVLDALGKPSSNVPFIMPERIARTPATQPISDPTGSGPFIMKRDEWVPGAKVVYVKNPQYVPRQQAPSGLAGAKLARVDRVEWVYMPDPQTAFNALQAGELDLFEEVPPDLMKLLARNPRVRVMPQDSLWVQAFFRMNSAAPPFNNPKIRQAIRHMVDQTAFLRAYVEDPALHKNCPSFYQCSSPYFTDAGWAKPDLERARQLVKEAGYDGSPVIVLHATDSTVTHTFSLVAEEMMRSIGLKVDPQSMDWGTLTARRASKTGWSLFISSPTGADALDPIGHLGLRANCEKAWFGWPCDEQIEALRTEFSLVSDMDQRRRIARAVQLRALEVVPYVPLGQFSLVRGVSTRVSGLLNAAVPVYWNIQKAE
jgi:peptide/nickel transport system substrate-binding protein